MSVVNHFAHRSMDSTVGELQPGDPQSVGPYRLLGRLGAGGMGRVYLGRSPGGRLVAVKIIRPELAEVPGFRIRFAREVAAARNVSGLFTALVVDADPEGPMPWLATVYVAGPSLSEAVDEQGPLPLASVLALAAGLAEGLEAIHAAGVVHRDLKPSNVLLAQDGPRMIDFGISRAAEATMLTQPGIVMGSPGFLSPEQAEGGTIGPPSDVFSLGAVLAFAATGEGPFGTGITPALMYRVISIQPDISRVPGQIRSLVGHCLAKNPADRPTASDLLAELGAGQFASDWLPASLTEALSRYSAHNPQLAAGLTDSPGYAPGDGALRGTPPSAGPSGQASVTVPAGRLDSTADANPTTDRPGHPQRRNGRRLTALAATAAALVLAGSSAAAIALSSGAAPHQSAATSPSRTTPRPSTSVRTSSPATSAVPAVLGDTLVAAASALKKNGFENIPYLRGCYGSGNIGDVVKQAPGSGTIIALTSPVHLYLQANNCYRVPDVVGLNLSSAEYQLKQAGFSNIQYMYNCYDSPNIDEVVRQSPGSGSSYGSTQPVAIDLQDTNC
jgi:eukaryotic-like serine/threonine-protein kinase